MPYIFCFGGYGLFAVLPFGVRSQLENKNVSLGTDPGAPNKPYVLRKFLINSLVAAIVFAIYWIITEKLGFSIDDIPSPFPQDQ